MSMCNDSGSDDTADHPAKTSPCGEPEDEREWAFLETSSESVEEQLGPEDLDLDFGKEVAEHLSQHGDVLDHRAEPFARKKDGERIAWVPTFHEWLEDHLDRGIPLDSSFEQKVMDYHAMSEDSESEDPPESEVQSESSAIQREKLVWVPTLVECLADHLGIVRADQDLMDNLYLLEHVVSQIPEGQRSVISPHATGDVEPRRRDWVPTFHEWLQQHVDIGHVDPLQIEDIVQTLVSLHGNAHRHSSEEILESNSHYSQEIESEQETENEQVAMLNFSDWVEEQIRPEYLDPASRQEVIEHLKQFREVFECPAEKHVRDERVAWVPTFHEWLEEPIGIGPPIDPAFEKKVMEYHETSNDAESVEMTELQNMQPLVTLQYDLYRHSFEQIAESYSYVSRETESEEEPESERQAVIFNSSECLDEEMSLDLLEPINTQEIIENGDVLESPAVPRVKTERETRVPTFHEWLEDHLGQGRPIDRSFKLKVKEYHEMSDASESEDAGEQLAQTGLGGIQHDEQPVRVPTFAEWLADHLGLDRVDPTIRQDVMEALDMLGNLVSRVPEQPRGEDFSPSGRGTRPRGLAWVPTFKEWLQEHVEVGHVDPALMQDITQLLVTLKDAAHRGSSGPQGEMDLPVTRETESELESEEFPTFDEWASEYMDNDHLHPDLKEGLL